jgi:hypothetical protein
MLVPEADEIRVLHPADVEVAVGDFVEDGGPAAQDLRVESSRGLRAHLTWSKADLARETGQAPVAAFEGAILVAKAQRDRRPLELVAALITRGLSA